MVRQGPLYAPKYVSLLQKQISRFHDVEFVTLTDQPDTPGTVRPLRHGFKGWWAKMELFAPENADLRPCLFIDLDSYVLDPIDHLAGGQEFRMVDDFLNEGHANSCVMWIPEDVDHIWRDFIANPQGHMDRVGKKGDQAYLEAFSVANWDNEMFGVLSYRKHARDEPRGAVVQFHGHPKPHEAKGWAGDIWNEPVT